MSVDSRDEPDLGEVVRHVVEDGKAYAQAEVELLKVKARLKAEGYKKASVFFGAAGLLSVAALVVLLDSLATALATLIGPLAAGLVVVAATLGLAAVLGLIGKKKLERMP